MLLNQCLDLQVVGRLQVGVKGHHSGVRVRVKVRWFVSVGSNLWFDIFDLSDQIISTPQPLSATFTPIYPNPDIIHLPRPIR